MIHPPLCIKYIRYLQIEEQEIISLSCLLRFFLNFREGIIRTGVYNKGMKAGWQDSAKEGEMKKARETVLNLAGRGISVADIADVIKVSLETVQKWLSGNVSMTK